MRGYRSILAPRILVCFIVLTAIPFHAQQKQMLHGHVRAAVSSGQARPVGSLPGNRRLQLAIMLPVRNQSELKNRLARLYDASSPDYRRFLSVSEFTEEFGPTAQDYQGVVNFAKANGFTVTATAGNRLLVDVSASVAQIEKAFHVNMRLYRHPTENRYFYSPDREPSLDLSVPVSHIAGMNDYSLPQPMVKKTSVAQLGIANLTGSGPGGSYLGSDMRAAYYGSTALTGSGQAVGLLEFGGYNLSDVDLNFSSVGQTYNVPVNNVLLDGATGLPNGDDAEEVLDIVQSISMAPGLSQVLVYIAPAVLDVDVFNRMATDNIAKQLSCSWLWYPEDASADDPIFQEFAAQGQNLFVASGDYGAYENFISSPFYFPAEDANVTAVGGTELTTNGAGGVWQSETSWNGVLENAGTIGSGGGVSPDAIPLPQFQLGIANALNQASKTVRNLPDVAAEANTDNYVCNLGVCDGFWGGTSFAAPRWAGFLALANQQQVAAGQPTLGFINPAIYAMGQSSSYGSVLHDITTGNNDVTAGVLGGFNAVPGYDLVTGWGSPNGQKLIDALPAPIFALAASPNSLTIVGSGSSTISLNATSNFSGTVNLSASNLPSGVTASFNPTSISGKQTSKLTLTANGGVMNGDPLVTVTGTSGSLSANTPIALSVDFGTTVAPATQTVTTPNSVTYTTTVTFKTGFTGTVNLSVRGLPSGATGTFKPPSLSASGKSVLTISTTASTATGTFNLGVEATTGNLTQNISVPLIVNAPSTNFGMSASPATVTIGQTGVTAGVSTIAVTSLNNFSGPVTLSASGVPAGATALFSPNPVTPSPDGTVTSTLTLSEITWPAPYGTFPVTVTGTSAFAVANVSLTLTVDPLLFILSAEDANKILTPGSGVQTPIFLSTTTGFNSPITLSVSGLPSGVTGAFSPNPVIPVVSYGTSTLTLTASSSTAPGSYAITVTATSGGSSENIVLTLTITTVGFTISASPASLAVPQGSSKNDKITVTSQNGFSGQVALFSLILPDGVTVTYNPALVTVPANGAATANLTVQASPAASTGSFGLAATGQFFDSTTASFQIVTDNVPVNVTGNKSTFVTLSSAFNREGIYDDGLDTHNVTNGLDTLGHAYSANLLFGWNEMWNNIPFMADTLIFANNVVSGTGQTVVLPAGKFSSVAMVGTAVNGQQASQTFTITYTDGTTTILTQSLSDWQKPQNFAGEAKVFTMAYVDDVFNGGRLPKTTYLYGYSFAIDNTRTVKSVTLPKNSNVEVLAMTLVP